MTNNTIISIDGANLRKIVAAASFADTDKTLPVLTAVNLVIEGDTLTAFATDRYKLIEAEIAADISGGDRSAMIGPDAIKAMRGATSRVSSAARMFTLTIEGDTPMTSKWILSDYTGIIASGQLIEGEYPAVRRLFPETDVLAPFAARLNPRHVAALAEFERISRAESRGWAFGSTGANKAVVAAVPDARALLMPIRVADENLAPELYGGHVIDPNASVTVKGAAKTEPVDMAKLRAEIAAELRAEIAAEVRAEIAAEPVAEPVKTEPAAAKTEPVTDYAAMIADVPNVTEKMTARLIKALERGDNARDAVVFATGTDKGKRSAALIEALANA